jgi:hypothetical protein
VDVCVTRRQLDCIVTAALLAAAVVLGVLGVVLFQLATHH